MGTNESHASLRGEGYWAAARTLDAITARRVIATVIVCTIVKSLPKTRPVTCPPRVPHA